MAKFKMTAIFRQVTNTGGASQGNRIAGWSESLYRESNDFPLARAAFENWCNIRTFLLGSGASITGQRYELIDPEGRTQTASRVFRGTTILCDVPQAALTFTVPALSSPHVRRFTLRGCQDGLIVEGEYQPTPASTNAFALLVRAMNGFAIRVANLTAPFVAIMSVDATGNFVLASPLTFGVGDKVTVKNVKQGSQKVPTNDFFILARTDDRHGQFSNWTAGVCYEGAMRPQLVTYQQLDSTVTVTPQATVRKVGRPLSGYVGRAHKRA